MPTAERPIAHHSNFRTLTEECRLLKHEPRKDGALYPSKVQWLWIFSWIGKRPEYFAFGMGE